MLSTALTALGRTRLDFHATRIAIVPPSASQSPQSAADSGHILQERPCLKVLHCSHRPTQEPDCQELCKQIHSLQSIFPTVLSHLGAESHISMHMCEWRHERDGGRAAPTVGCLQQQHERMTSRRLYSLYDCCWLLDWIVLNLFTVHAVKSECTVFELRLK